ncbi:MAG: hypothetical protein AB7J13_09245 [Pyrinomonadaceae bacterium]
MLQSAFAYSHPYTEEKSLVLLRLLTVFVLSVLTLTFSASAFGQEETPAVPAPTPVATPSSKVDIKNVTVEQVVESSIFLYGYPGGRVTLNQIRKTTQERGTANITNAEGKVDKVTYQRFIIRGDSLAAEKIRLDQEFPSARYALIYADDKIYGVYNNTVFTPREDAAKTFENQIVRGLEALLRYKENGSTIELADKDKIMGVEYFIVDVTDKQGRKTRFFVSTKSFRVMMLTYEEDGVRYKRKFYDYNYAQGTLVPFRTVLWANDKVVEETEIGTITFGQKVDEGLFSNG